MVVNLDKFRKYGSHIRSLFVTEFGRGKIFDEQLLIRYISCCPNVTNLALWRISSPLITDGLADLPLTRMWINLQSLLSDPPSPKLLKLFANITHLHLNVNHNPLPFVNANGDSLSLRDLFPSLTHIALLYTQSQTHLKAVVNDWYNLQVIVLWYPDEHTLLSEDVYLDGEGDIRPRPVIIACDDLSGWEDGARGRGPDIWECAEKVIRLRPAAN